MKDKFKHQCTIRNSKSKELEKGTRQRSRKRDCNNIGKKGGKMTRLQMKKGHEVTLKKKTTKIEKEVIEDEDENINLAAMEEKEAPTIVAEKKSV